MKLALTISVPGRLVSYPLCEKEYSSIRAIEPYESKANEFKYLESHGAAEDSEGLRIHEKWQKCLREFAIGRKQSDVHS